MISGILGADDITATVKRLKVQVAEHLQKR